MPVGEGRGLGCRSAGWSMPYSTCRQAVRVLPHFCTAFDARNLVCPMWIAGECAPCCTSWAEMLNAMCADAQPCSVKAGR